MCTTKRSFYLNLVTCLLFLLLEVSAQTTQANEIGIFCDSDNDVIKGTSQTWAELAKEGIIRLGTTYLRPDSQALLPWIYTVVIFVFHVPTVIIRVVRWENVQILCVVVSISTNVLYTLAYVSTDFKPEQILVWTPILLIIDGGSMAQVLFLVNEDRFIGLRLRCQLAGMEHGDAFRLARAEDNRRSLRQHRDPRSDQELHALLRRLWWKDGRVYTAIIATLSLLHTVVLQSLGLAFAIKASQASEPPMSRWCSPFFQPFGMVVRDGECNIYQIDQSTKQGIGCISIPGVWQQRWLHGTIIGTAIGIACEAIDIFILFAVDQDWKPLRIKMRRPWCTMFSGVAVLLVTMIFGKLYADDLPPHITHKIWLVSKSDTPKLYSVQLESAGLRGAIIGWSDGLFGSWGTDYFGSGH